MQTFYYKNTLGFHKMLEIAEVPKQDGTYHVRLWCTDNGELCGYNDLTLEEIERFLDTTISRGLLFLACHTNQNRRTTEMKIERSYVRVTLTEDELNAISKAWDIVDSINSAFSAGFVRFEGYPTLYTQKAVLTARCLLGDLLDNGTKPFEIREN